MRRNAWLPLLALGLGCVQAREKPHFDDSGTSPSGGGTNPQPHTTTATGATSSGASGTGTGAGGGGGGAPIQASCHCVYEIGHVTGCGDCAVVAEGGICSALFNDCEADTECASLLQFCIPQVQDDPAAVAACFTASQSSRKLLDDYLSCLCNDPGACVVECHASLSCGPGGTGATTSATGAGGAGG